MQNTSFSWICVYKACSRGGVRSQASATFTKQQGLGLDWRPCHTAVCRRVSQGQPRAWVQCCCPAAASPQPREPRWRFRECQCHLHTCSGLSGGRQCWGQALQGNTPGRALRDQQKLILSLLCTRVGRGKSDLGAWAFILGMASLLMGASSRFEDSRRWGQRPKAFVKCLVEHPVCATRSVNLSGIVEN